MDGIKEKIINLGFNYENEKFHKTYVNNTDNNSIYYDPRYFKCKPDLDILSLKSGDTVSIDNISIDLVDCNIMHEYNYMMFVNITNKRNHKSTNIIISIIDGLRYSKKLNDKDNQLLVDVITNIIDYNLKSITNITIEYKVELKTSDIDSI